MGVFGSVGTSKWGVDPLLNKHTACIRNYICNFIKQFNSQTLELVNQNKLGVLAFLIVITHDWCCVGYEIYKL